MSLHQTRAMIATAIGAALFATMIVAPPVSASPVAASPVTAADAVVGPIDFPDSYPHQPQLHEYPDNPADASIGRGAIPYDEIAPMLNHFMAETDIVSSQVIGKSANGWDMYLVTVTAPETAEQTAQQAQWRDEVKYDSAAAAEDEELLQNYKSPVWFNGNIHGNEWEGTDASLEYIEQLVENENLPSVQYLLDHYRMYFTVTNNPDGRIIGQRGNGQNLDLNRDWVTNQSPEDTILRDLTAFIQPTFFIDLHGYTGVLQVEPCGPPHGENYDYDLFIGHAYAAALQIEEDVVDAAIPGNTYRDKITGATSTTLDENSGIRIPYRDTPSGWDDWPPVFTAQYVAYQGAIAYTAELPLGRSNNPATNQFNSSVDTEVAVQVIDSTMDYMNAHGDEILANQIEIFRRGGAGEPLRTIEPGLDPASVEGPTEWVPLWDAADAAGHTPESVPQFPRGYVIPVGDEQKSDSDAAYLVDYLRGHGLQVSQATEDFTAGGVAYDAGSYVVDMHQPLRGLVNALLAPGSDISDVVPSMYDISAWSHGYLWGATVAPIGSTTDADLPVETVAIDAADDTGSVPDGRTYLTFELDGVDDFAGLDALLDAGVPASMIGTNTVVLGNSAGTYEAAADVAGEYGIAFEPTTGLELGSGDVKPLDELQVGYTGTQDDRLTLFSLGFDPDQLTPLTAANLQAGAQSLDDIDVLWLGSALTITPDSPVAYADMQEYLAVGKGFAGRGSGANTFANTWYDAQATSVAGNNSGNGIVHLDTVEDGVLGALGTEYGFVYPALSFAVADEGSATVAQTYGAGNPLISGHWRATNDTNGPLAAAGRASVYTSELASTGGRATVFGTAVAFRGHPRGHFSEIGTSLYWAAPPATEDVLEVPVATDTVLTLTDAEVPYGMPAEAIVKVTATEAVDSRRGTAVIMSGDEVIATATVNGFGNARTTLPMDLPSGAYELTAVYTPDDRLLVASASAAVGYTVVASPARLFVDMTVLAYGSASSVDVSVIVEGATPTGTVSVSVDEVLIETVDLVDASATVLLPADLPAGTHPVLVQYSGDAATAPLSVTGSITIEPAATTTVLALSKKSVVKGGRVKATATVAIPGSSVAASGAVTFKVDCKSVVGELVDGEVTVKLPKLKKTGTYKVKAVFGGTENLEPSKDTATVTVKKS